MFLLAHTEMNALPWFVFPSSAHSHFPSTRPEHIHCHLNCLLPEGESIPNLQEGMQTVAIWLACCKGVLSTPHMHKGMPFNQVIFSLLILKFSQPFEQLFLYSF